MKPDQTSSDRLESVVTGFNQTKLAQTGFEQIKPDQNGSNPIKPDQMGSNRFSPAQTGSDQTGSQWTQMCLDLLQPDQTTPDRLLDWLKPVLTVSLWTRPGLPGFERLKPDTNRTRPAKTGWKRLKPDQTGSNGIKPDQNGSNQL